jgi:hypothetical protein
MPEPETLFTEATMIKKVVQFFPVSDERKSATPLFVESGEYNHQPNFGIRHSYLNDVGEVCRTRKGINIPLEDVPALIAKMQEVYDEATS